MVTRVLIVDDHPLFRDGLGGLLATMPDIDVAGSVGSAEDALDFVRSDVPDVVLMDLNLPGVPGVEATRQVLDVAPGTAVLVVTMVDDDDAVLAAIRAGARGYVLKGATGDEIRAAIRTVAAGGAVFGAAIAVRLAQPVAPRPSVGEQLTPREAEVLALLADGQTNKQIARSLGLSLKTVQNHVARILDKLQAADRTQAALRARGIAPGG